MRVWNVAVAGLALAVLGGCASHAKRPLVDETAFFVDQAVDPTIQSIDRSLQTLVVLSRGDEAPRRPGAIADTVAGAAGPNRPALKPSDMPAKPGAPAPVKAAPPVAPGVAALETRVRLEWHGSAWALLEQLGSAAHYQVEGKNPAVAALTVNVKAEDTSVKDVLANIARQLDGKADVHVDANRRVLRLISLK